MNMESEATHSEYARWYNAIGGESVSNLVDLALKKDPQIAAFRSRLRQAGIQTRRSRSFFLPSAGIGMRAGRQRERISNETQSDENLVDFTAAVRWEADIRGSLRQSVQAGLAREKIAQVEYEIERTRLAAEVVSEWLRWNSGKVQSGIYGLLIEDAIQQVDFIDQSYLSGDASRLDLLESKTNLRALRSLALEAETQTALASSRLTALCGLEAVQNLEISRIEIGNTEREFSFLVDTNAMLERRLELKILRAGLDKQNAQLAKAIAEQWPKLTLSINIASSAESFTSLFEDQLVNLLADLFWNSFEGGRKRLKVDLEKERTKELMLLFEAASLDAIDGAGRAAIRLRDAEAQLEQTRLRSELAEERLEEANKRYLNGQERYDRVLDARIQRQILLIESSTRKQTLGEAQVDFMLQLGWSE